MFDISFLGFINFFIGMMTGMVVFAAIYIQFLIRGKNINVEEIKRPNIKVDEEELKLVIIDKQKKFKRNKKLGNQSIAKLTFEMSYELIDEISKYFFPDSKYPMLELSVNELLNLNHYVTNRLDEILDKPILKNTKNLQMTKIMDMYNKKKAFDQNKLIKAAKKYKVGKVVKYGGAVLNAFNPVYWFRKLVINTSIDAMTKKICLVVIAIVGEETINIYSKKLFDKPLELNVVEKEMLTLLEEGDDEALEED